MSYFTSLTFQDDVYHDAFGRLKVSQPEPLFDNMSEYGNNSFLWETKFSGGGATHVANQNAIRLSTGGTTSGNYAYRATRKYMRYQPGRSLNIETTFVMSAVATNSRARIGYFDTNNGIFLERSRDATTTTVQFVRRTYVTGSPADNVVVQNDWNVDKFDGNGISGKTLNLTKANIMFIQLQYLGVGRVQVGFVFDGVPYVAHQFLNTGVLSTVYMSTGCLPVRGEVENTGTSDGTLTMDMICTSVSTGGIGNELVQWAISNGVTAKSTSTALTPLVTIRAATLFGGTTGGGSIVNRGHIIPTQFDVAVTSQIHEYQIIRNAASFTAASWQNNNAESIADYDLAATALSGGTVLESGYLAASSSVRASQSISVLKENPVVYTGLNNFQGTITLAVRTVTGTGTAFGSVTWREEY